MAVDVTTLVTVVGRKTVGTTNVVVIGVTGSPEPGNDPSDGAKPDAELDWPPFGTDILEGGFPGEALLRDSEPPADVEGPPVPAEVGGRIVVAGPVGALVPGVKFDKPAGEGWPFALDPAGAEPGFVSEALGGAPAAEGETEPGGLVEPGNGEEPIPDGGPVAEGAAPLEGETDSERLPETDRDGEPAEGPAPAAEPEVGDTPAAPDEESAPERVAVTDGNPGLNGRPPFDDKPALVGKPGFV